MMQKDGKPNQPDKNSRTVSTALIVIVLCGLSFYLGGIFCSEKNRYGTRDISEVVETSKETASTPLQIKAVTFPECGSGFQDYTPCTDPKVIAIYSFLILGLSVWYFKVINTNDIMPLL